MKVLTIKDCDECTYHEINHLNETHWCAKIHPSYVVRLHKFPEIPESCPLSNYVGESAVISLETWIKMKKIISIQQKAAK